MALWDRSRWACRSKFIGYVTVFLLSPHALWGFPLFWAASGAGVCLLIPLATCFILLGLPLFFLELSLGQFMQGAGLRVWGVAPLFRGLGVTATIVALMRCTMNLMVTSWACYYLYLILTNQLSPCVRNMLVGGALDDAGEPGVVVVNGSVETETDSERPLYNVNGSAALFSGPLSSSEVLESWPFLCRRYLEQLWRTRTLSVSPRVMEPGTAMVHVFMGLVAGVCVCFMLSLRGMNGLGTLMSLLLPASVLLLLAFPVGAWLNGDSLETRLAEAFMPNFDPLTDPKVWAGCVRQTLLTFGLGVHVLPSAASFGRFGNDIYRDTLILFSLAVLGHVISTAAVMAVIRSPDVTGLRTDDPEFVFVTLAMALTYFSPHVVWTSLLFLCVTVLAVTSSLVYVDTITSAFVDVSTRLKRWRLAIMAGVLATSFLLTIPLTTQGGIYLFWLLQRVVDGGVLTSSICLLQCVIIAYVYGSSLFCDNLGVMTGRQFTFWFKFCWAGLCPLALAASLGYHGYLYHAQPVPLGSEESYPRLSSVLVVALTFAPLLPLPLVALRTVCTGNGACGERLQSSLRPDLKPYQIPISWRLHGQHSRLMDFSPVVISCSTPCCRRVFRLVSVHRRPVVTPYRGAKPR